VNAGTAGRAAGPALRGLGLLYRGGVALRNALYDSGRLKTHRLPCAVIGIGNLTVGGTGKTPLTSFLAGLLRESGYRVGVASRGYRRRGGGRPLLVSDGRSILADAQAAGDEPFLIARENPAVAVAVGADRLEACNLLVAAHAPEAILLDDAFQHRRIARDLNLLLVDGRDPWDNGKMLPLGPLREPLSAMSRADAVVVTRSEGRPPAALVPILQRFNPEAPVFHCRLEPGCFRRPDGESFALSTLKGFAVYAFSGIARPDRFEEDLARLGVRIAGSRRFSDHHRYRRGELAELGRAARAAGAEFMVTTEKDLVRLVEPLDGPPPLYALALRVEHAAGTDLGSFILDRLARPRTARDGRLVP
jgi:tetraacyldisaccharide 4'-kinase